MKPSCENCGKLLANTSDEAMICTFECTYCATCVETVLHNVCPNCGGGFEKRPTRPAAFLKKYPLSDKTVYKPIDDTKFPKLLHQYKEVPPRER